MLLDGIGGVSIVPTDCITQWRARGGGLSITCFSSDWACVLVLVRDLSTGGRGIVVGERVKDDVISG